MDPVFWLGVSLFLVAISLTVVLVVAIPAFQELSKAAQSAQKLFDLLQREIPSTLEALRRTGVDLSDLSEDLSESIQTASHVVKQVDESLMDVKHQVQRAGIGTTSFLAGVRASIRSLTRSKRQR
jgi:uncharacterized protein YoxC